MTIDKKVTCTFTGHRPEKLTVPEWKIESFLEKSIRNAINDGYVNFIHGAQRGVDLMAAMIVLRLKEEYPQLCLITAIPFEGFDNDFDAAWKEKLKRAVDNSSQVVTVSKKRGASGYMARNDWMVDHSSRLIAVYNGGGGGTKHTIDYAKESGDDVVKL